MAIQTVMAAYRLLSPRDLAYLANYNDIHQRPGDRPGPLAIDYGTIYHQRQWMGYHALRLIVDFGWGQKLSDNLVYTPLWPDPPQQLPADITSFYTFPNTQLSAQQNPFWSPAEKVRARKSYWTGKPARRRNL